MELSESSDPILSSKPRRPTNVDAKASSSALNKKKKTPKKKRTPQKRRDLVSCNAPPATVPKSLQLKVAHPPSEFTQIPSRGYKAFG
uniref:Uncharacterized protein n=1 Tax=Oryza punctata TaxID=4537 RepID=A0A0E0LJW2_ORYPU